MKAHAVAREVADPARSKTFADLVRTITSQPAAARPCPVVTTEVGAGRAQPAPCKPCARPQTKN